ncbi:helix-turn-helix transcriptional regulator [Staphylococcus pettenkoferi]|uniref:Helix-turn-helix transcriptional regulator n=1 Tax=Staphylococcus pettenkoferi TaxID=170573 RepID=A0ABT4BPA3_9STAP|nr:helix-turn-helix transcriptional regulator [Staphylococcus pettenkoferi]MCY1584428.1 helix-turn-helix transcriptional regulator [Staphylococcus pettenkoferi]MCY1602883.1 helix-turn-helix transcriptional regulator [Staphylococcus pettenkoferi]
MNLNEVLGTNIRILMARDKITVSKLAKEAGIARSTITSYRDGHIKMINLEVLDTIADYFGVNASVLLRRNDYNSSL